MKRTPLLLIIVPLFCFFSAVALCGCDNAAATSTPALADTGARGNSDANLNHMGLAAARDTDVYCVGSRNDYDIVYEADAAGQGKRALFGLTGYIRFLNVTDDAFYFIGVTSDGNGNDSEALFRVDADGMNKSRLFAIDPNLTVVYMTVAGETALYAAATAEGESRVCALDLRNGGETTLFTTENEIQSLNIAGGNLYYIADNAICRRALDGTGAETLYTSNIWLGNMVFGNNCLYFVETERDKTDSIKSLKPDGSDKKTLISDLNWVNELNIRDQTLYYADHTYDSDGHFQSAAFYGLDLTTGKTRQLGQTKKDYVGFDVAGANLFYHLKDDNFTVKHISL